MKNVTTSFSLILLLSAPAFAMHNPSTLAAAASSSSSSEKQQQELLPSDGDMSGYLRSSAIDREWQKTDIYREWQKTKDENAGDEQKSKAKHLEYLAHHSVFFEKQSGRNTTFEQELKRLQAFHAAAAASSSSSSENQ